MKNFIELTIQDLKKWLEKEDYPGYASDQIFQWVYERHQFDFEKMTNLKTGLREKLKQTFRLPTLELLETEESKTSEVTKFLWKLPDQKRVESVLIRSGDRRTVCVSSQVGCNARCSFCASGKEGFFRNLTAGEIIEQILLIDQHLKAEDERVSHVVFMGMGEPLDNYDEVIKAVHQLIHPKTLNLSQRRITISTVGVIDGIVKLSEENLKINLVLSLHAPNQHIRKKIIPYARKYDLHDVLKAMDVYFQKTGRDITYEYILIDQINAEKQHALELAKLLQNKQCTVNLIPYNPIDQIQMRRPSKEKIYAFREILMEAKVPVTWRYTKGKDIAAACGQLALKKQGVEV